MSPPRTCFCVVARSQDAGWANGSSGVHHESHHLSAAGPGCGTGSSAGNGSESGTRSGNGSGHGDQSGSGPRRHGESGSWSWSGSWRSSKQKKRRRRSGGCRWGTGAKSVQASAATPLGPSSLPWWPGCRTGSLSVTDRALVLRPGAGPPGWGAAGGFPVAAPDAAAAAAAAAASSSLPPKLVMNVIFSSRPGVGERERERDSELDSEGDLRWGRKQAAQDWAASGLFPSPLNKAPAEPDSKTWAGERYQVACHSWGSRAAGDPARQYLTHKAFANH